MNTIYFTKKDLLRRMKEHGLPCSDMWLRYQEAKGHIISPRLPNNNRIYTEQQIKEIIHAFSPGGKGIWQTI